MVNSTRRTCFALKNGQFCARDIICWLSLGQAFSPKFLIVIHSWMAIKDLGKNALTTPTLRSLAVPVIFSHTLERAPSLGSFRSSRHLFYHGTTGPILSAQKSSTVTLQSSNRSVHLRRPQHSWCHWEKTVDGESWCYHLLFQTKHISQPCTNLEGVLFLIYSFFIIWCFWTHTGGGQKRLNELKVYFFWVFSLPLLFSFCLLVL